MWQAIFESDVHLRKISKKTTKRKIDYLALKARQKNNEFLVSLSKEQVTHMQFDDLITTEHTKLKPLSVSIAVDADRRFILAAEVSQIPAFGHHKVHKIIHPEALIRSDEHNNYPEFVTCYLPEALKWGKINKKICTSAP